MDLETSKRHFYKAAVFVKWSHITTFLAYPDGLFASVPERRNAAGKVRKFSQDYGPNMNCLLHFMVNHMGRQNVNGVDTDEKDVAQAFFGRQSYVEAETGMSQSSISLGFSALVEAGVLIRDEIKGKAVMYAFSPRTINALLAYSEKRRIKELAENAANKPVLQDNMTHLTVKYDSFDSQIRLIRQSNMTHSTVKYGSYIEERCIESRKESRSESPMNAQGKEIADVAETSEPEGYRKLAFIRDPVVQVIKLSEKVEKHIWTNRYKTPTYDETNLFIAGLIDRHGLRQVWDWTEWLPGFRQGRSWRKGMTWEEQMQSAWNSWMQNDAAYRSIAH